jgi:hypothetical protein
LLAVRSTPKERWAQAVVEVGRREVEESRRADVTPAEVMRFALVPVRERRIS